MTDPKELEEAITRIGRKQEAKQSSIKSRAWIDYLKNVLGVDPENVDRYGNFWEDVRQGVNKLPRKHFIGEYSKRQLDENNAYVHQNKRTRQVLYKNKETGRFIKINS